MAFKINGKIWPDARYEGKNIYISARMKKPPKDDPDGRIVNPITAYKSGMIFHPDYKNYDTEEMENNKLVFIK